MAYRVLSRYHRPSDTVAWHSAQVFDLALNNEIMEMMLTLYHDRKTRIVTEVSPLILEVEFIWETQALYEEWAMQPCIVRQRQLIDEYNTSVGIILDPQEKTEL